jgi:hypothetical protein
VYTAARFRLWRLSYLWPRRLAAGLIRRPPRIQNFPAGRQNSFFERLRRVNTYSPTEMCTVMTKHGSDKGAGTHNYTTVYAELFGGLRERPLLIFELGLGAIYPDLRSNMGVTGCPGASLRGWRELFPRAQIFGADIERTVLFESHRIKTFYCDQLDAAAIRDLWKQPSLEGGVDILIEDGLHTFEANISFLEGSLRHVRKGGIYVVEDVEGDTLDRWSALLETSFVPRFPDCEFAIVALPNTHNDRDNNLIMVHRKDD